MTCHPWTRLLRIAAVPLVFLLTASPVWSQTEPGFAREGGFAGVAYLPDFTFDGVTFDGETIYQEIGGEELVILPRLDARNLVRYILGYRGRQAAIEVSYDRTRHDGTFLDFAQTATFQAVNVDGRFFFATRSPVQPHVLIGGALPWFRVKEGSFLDPDLADARFRGFALNTEAGVTVYPHRQVGVSVGYNYRVMWFDRVTGVTDTLFELRPRFRETVGAVAVAVTGVFSF